MQSTIETPSLQESFARLAARPELANSKLLYRELGSHGTRIHSLQLAWSFWKARTAWILRSKSFGLVKRIIDIIASATALIVLAPTFLVIAVAIKSCDGGSVLFWQNRVGRWGKVFRFPKFRSMKPDAELTRAKLLAQNHHGSSVTFKIPRDPRVTPVGRVLRRFSLDELPQLWCVLNGDMSLVGPRPALPSEVEHYTLEQRRRLDVVPGLTCIWQVSGRADVPFPRQVEMDVAYIENQSLGQDLRLIMRTIPTIAVGKGAY
jgi:lipopolysaccharide/colanic/teichoic acid biosynthesis glycosyltransferase